MNNNKETKPTGECIKICFVALRAYPLLAERNMGFVGGSCLQQVILAKELVKHNFEVSFITYTDDQASIEYIGDIKVIKVYKPEEIHTLFFLTKVRQIWRAMKEANADIYFHKSVADGIVSLFCRLARKKFVQGISSDSKVDKKAIECLKQIEGIKLRERVGNWLDIKLADVLIAQSEFQREAIKKKFGVVSFIIKNAFSLSDQKMSEKVNPPIVLWVSTIRKIKQPGLFLKLAEAIPEGCFQMIGGVAGRGNNNIMLYNSIKENSDGLSNLHFIGFVPFNKIDKYFSRAAILVNTSKFEGFPNTFLQAWAACTPVVSLIDPDEIICKYKLGFHSGTFERMVEDVKILLKDEKLREEMGMNGRRYVEREHDIKKIMEKYAKIFIGLLERRRK